jgi:hypothetical protein
MARGTAAVIVALATLVPAGTLVAQHPDFSGRWVTPPERVGGRGAVGSLGSGWGDTITVAQQANRLTVEYPFFAPRDLQPPLIFAYALDGTTTTNHVMMGRGIQESTSTTAWRGDTLVITTHQSFPATETGQPMTVEVRRALSLASATSLVVEVTRSGVLGGKASTTRTVYTRS